MSSDREVVRASHTLKGEGRLAVQVYAKDEWRQVGVGYNSDLSGALDWLANIRVKLSSLGLKNELRFIRLARDEDGVAPGEYVRGIGPIEALLQS